MHRPGYRGGDIANIAEILTGSPQLTLHLLSIPARLSVKVRLAEALN
jgi:hypothetical protein